MNITKAAGSVVLGLASMLGSYGCASQRAYAEDPPVTKEPAKNLETITDEQITTLMKFETVEEILKEDKIIPAKFEYVTYDVEKKTNNYDKLVFQEDLKKEERKPVLVFFYKNKDPPGTKILGGAHREAIIFKKLYQDFGDKIKFVCFEVNTDPELLKKGNTEFMKNYGIDGCPSIAMYADVDVVKKDAPDGKLDQIDILGGGPNLNEGIKTTYENARDYWIKPSIFDLPNPHNNGRLYRYQNKFDLVRVVKQ